MDGVTPQVSKQPDQTIRSDMSENLEQGKEGVLWVGESLLEQIEQFLMDDDSMSDFGQTFLQIHTRLT